MPTAGKKHIMIGTHWEEERETIYRIGSTNIIYWILTHSTIGAGRQRHNIFDDRWPLERLAVISCWLKNMMLPSTRPHAVNYDQFLLSRSGGGFVVNWWASLFANHHSCSSCRTAFNETQLRRRTISQMRRCPPDIITHWGALLSSPLE